MRAIDKDSLRGLPGATAASVRKISRPAVRYALEHWVRHDELVRVRQQVRYLTYSELLRRQSTRPQDLTLFELSVFSQNGEDGVLQEILRRLQVTSGTFIEIGASVNEANTMLLADQLGWKGLYIDASREVVGGLRTKYAASDRVRVENAFVTAENINQLLEDKNAREQVTVLSIDIDGNDYWIWASLQAVRPAIVVVEVNSHVAPHEEWTQSYAPDHRWDGSRNFGASVAAFRHLAAQKDYAIVHVESTGTNAFFVDRNLVGDGVFPPEHQVVSRVPNFFLYGLNHPASRSPADAAHKAPG